MLKIPPPRINRNNFYNVTIPLQAADVTSHNHETFLFALDYRQAVCWIGVVHRHVFGCVGVELGVGTRPSRWSLLIDTVTLLNPNPCLVLPSSRCIWESMLSFWHTESESIAFEAFPRPTTCHEDSCVSALRRQKDRAAVSDAAGMCVVHLWSKNEWKDGFTLKEI